MKKPAIYILSNKKNGTIYVGVTSDLVKRIHQHKSDSIEGFTARYKLKNLVYYELHGNMLTAIAREKQIKSGSRKRKAQLIESVNKEWKDLFSSII